jgi:hypothetical protein
LARPQTLVLCEASSPHFFTMGKHAPIDYQALAADVIAKCQAEKRPIPVWCAPPSEWVKARKALLAICDVYGLPAQHILPPQGELGRGEVRLEPSDFEFLARALEMIPLLVQVPHQDEEAAQ